MFCPNNRIIRIKHRIITTVNSDSVHVQHKDSRIIVAIID